MTVKCYLFFDFKGHELLCISYVCWSLGMKVGKCYNICTAIVIHFIYKQIKQILQCYV